MYNTGTEMTITGTVEAVTQVTHGMRPGTHLTVRTNEGSLEVLLGPADFISGKGFAFQKGDPVKVTGSKVAGGGREALIARMVETGDKTLILRDKYGIPAWSRRGGRGAGQP